MLTKTAAPAGRSGSGAPKRPIGRIAGEQARPQPLRGPGLRSRRHVDRTRLRSGARRRPPAAGSTTRPSRSYLAELHDQGRQAALFQSMDPAGHRLTGRALERRVVLAMIKRRAAARGAPALDVLPHVPGDGDHGVPVERGNPRARPADRRARVAEDDEALRPDGGHGDGRRDRAYRDLNGAAAADAFHGGGPDTAGRPRPVGRMGPSVNCRHALGGASGAGASLR